LTEDNKTKETAPQSADFFGYNFRPDLFKGGAPSHFPGKTAHGPASGGMTRTRVLHREVELRTPAASENRKISGSPSGAPSPVFFPSEQPTL
jgi:hypothetical protein